MTNPFMNTVIAQANAKSSGVCIFLYLLFGLLGAHRYYINGVTLFNIIYTLSLGFLGFGVIIDFFFVWGMAGKHNAKLFQAAYIEDVKMREAARNANGN